MCQITGGVQTWCYMVIGHGYWLVTRGSLQVPNGFYLSKQKAICDHPFDCHITVRPNPRTTTRIILS